MKKRVLPLILLLLMACQRDELLLPDQSARARIVPDDGDDDHEDPIDEQAELNEFCYSLSRQPRFRNRMKLTARLVRTLDSANRAMGPEKIYELALIAQWIQNESHNEADAEWVIRQYGFASAAEMESLLMQIYAEDEWYATYALVQKYGVGRVYEQAHRYLFNPRYRLPSDRPAGQAANESNEHRKEDNPDDGNPPKDDPGTPFWDEHYGTWTNPTVDIYGYQQATGWSSQSAYQDYVSTINNYQGSADFFENLSGNPGIPFVAAPPPTQADKLKILKLQACSNVFNADMNIAQAAATVGYGGCIFRGWKGPKKSNGAMKLMTLLEAAGCAAGVTLIYRVAEDKIKADFIKCQLDAE